MPRFTAKVIRFAPVAALSVFLAAFSFVPATSAQEAGTNIQKTGVIEDDIYLTGRRVDVNAQVNGDVVAAGARVRIGNDIHGDVMALGGLVTVIGGVDDDVRVAAGEVEIGAAVAGDVIAAGGSVALMSDAIVAGRSWLAGGRVEVAGRIGGELRAVARSIVIAGTIDGDAILAARRVEILPSARIAGRLSYTSPVEAHIAEGAKIGGGIVRRVADVGFARRWYAGAVFGAFSLVWIVGLAAIGILFMAAFPVASRAAVRLIGGTIWKSMAVGFAVLVIMPVAAVLSFLSVLAIPLGLVLMASYFVALVIAYLTVAMGLGEWGLRRVGWGEPAGFWQRALAFVLGVIVLTMIGWIPFVGGLVLVLALIAGLGGWALKFSRAYTAGRS